MRTKKGPNKLDTVVTGRVEQNLKTDSRKMTFIDQFKCLGIAVLMTQNT